MQQDEEELIEWEAVTRVAISRTGIKELGAETKQLKKELNAVELQTSLTRPATMPCNLQN